MVKKRNILSDELRNINKYQVTILFQLTLAISLRMLSDLYSIKYWMNESFTICFEKLKQCIFMLKTKLTSYTEPNEENHVISYLYF